MNTKQEMNWSDRTKNDMNRFRAEMHEYGFAAILCGEQATRIRAQLEGEGYAVERIDRIKFWPDPGALTKLQSCGYDAAVGTWVSEGCKSA